MSIKAHGIASFSLWPKFNELDDLWKLHSNFRDKEINQPGKKAGRRIKKPRKESQETFLSVRESNGTERFSIKDREALLRFLVGLFVGN